jgi:hypothetical protein
MPWPWDLCVRGAGGDWTSLIQTVIEFSVAWPILPLTLAIILVEKRARTPVSAKRPRRKRQKPPAGFA